MATTLFTNVRVLDGRGGPPFEGQVLVEGNRIKRVARDGDAPGAAARAGQQAAE